MKFDNFEAVDNGFVNFINIPQSVGYEVKATDIYDFRSNLWLIQTHRTYRNSNNSVIQAPSNNSYDLQQALFIAPNTNSSSAKLIVRLEKNPNVAYNRTYELEAIWRFKKFRLYVYDFLQSLMDSSNYNYTTPIVTPLQDILGASMTPYISGCSQCNRKINGAWSVFNTQFEAKGYRLAIVIMNYNITTPNAPSGFAKIYTDSYSIPMDVGRQRRLYVQVQSTNIYNPFSATSNYNFNFIPHLRLMASRYATIQYLTTDYTFLENNGLILPSSEATNLFVNNIQSINTLNGIRVVTNATNT